MDLRPGDLPKHGAAYDFTIAIGVLASADQLPLVLESALFVRELSLDGSVRHPNLYRLAPIPIISARVGA